jgi:hypothetical protein
MVAILSIITLLIYPLINWVEAWLEDVVILLKDPKAKLYKRYNQQEHQRSFIYAALVCVPFLATAISCGWYGLLPAILVNRRLVFDFGLKLFRNKPLFTYEGDGPVDAFFKRLFGAQGAWKELAILLLITILSVLFTLIF